MILPALPLAMLLLAADAGDSRLANQLYNPGNVVDEQGVVRSRDGGRIGHIGPAENGTFALFDRDGRRVGIVQPGFGANELVIRDAAGRRQGTLGRRP